MLLDIYLHAWNRIEFFYETEIVRFSAITSDHIQGNTVEKDLQILIKPNSKTIYLTSFRK